MKKNIALFSLIFIAFLTLFGGANIASAKTISTCSSATLKGSVSSTRNNPTTVWFEWGKNSDEDSYPNATNSQVLTQSGSFSETISGLSPDTTYFYRALAQNRDGVTVGDLETFRTAKCSSTSSTTTRVVYRDVPVIKTVYVPASSNSMTYNYQYQNYRTIPIASSSSNSYSYNPAKYNQQYAAQSYNSYGANTLSSNVSLPFNLVELVVFLIIILAVAFVIKRILLNRAH